MPKNPWEENYDPATEVNPWEEDYTLKKKETSQSGLKPSGTASSPLESNSASLPTKLGGMPTINVPLGGAEGLSREINIQEAEAAALKRKADVSDVKSQVKSLINDKYGDVNQENSPEFLLDLGFVLNPDPVSELTGVQPKVLSKEDQAEVVDFANRYIEVKPQITKTAQRIQENPNDVEAITDLADLSNYAGDKSAALSLYTDAAAKKDNWRALNGLASIYQQEGQSDAALAAWSDAKKLNPNNIYADLNSAHILTTKGLFSESEKAIESAKAINPDVPYIYALSAFNKTQAGDLVGAKVDEATYRLKWWYANIEKVSEKLQNEQDIKQEQNAEYLNTIADALESPFKAFYEMEAGTIEGFKHGAKQFWEGSNKMAIGPNYDPVTGFLQYTNGVATMAFSGVMLGKPITNAAFHSLPEQVNKVLMEPIDLIRGLSQEEKERMSEDAQLSQQLMNTLGSIALLGAAHGVQKVITTPKLAELKNKDLDQYEEILNNSTIGDIKKAQEVWNTMPKDFSAETRLEIAPFVFEWNKLNDNMKTLGDAFKPAYEEKMKAVETEIQQKTGLSSEETIKAKEDATKKIIKQESVPTQPKEGTPSGEKPEAGVSDSVQRPTEVKEEVAGKSLFSKADDRIPSIVKNYKSEKGITDSGGEKITKIDEDQSKRIADEFEAMKHDPNNPKVREAYDAMVSETIDQYKTLEKDGYKVEIYEGKGEPYKSSKEMLADLRENKHLYVLSTEKEFGSGITEAQRAENPLLKDSGIKDANGKPLLANDVFRFVHDAFGHGERGNAFGKIGEENAWDVHSRMYSPTARRAMTTETRGQNSWVNFGKHLRDEAGNIKMVPPKDRPYAEQKIGLLPEWVSETIKPKDSVLGTPKERDTLIKALEDGDKRMSDVYGERWKESKQKTEIDNKISALKEGKEYKADIFEEVGENGKTFVDFQDKLHKAVSDETIKFQETITPKKLRDLLNKEGAATKTSSGTGAKSRQAGDYLYSQDRGSFDALLNDIKSGDNKPQWDGLIKIDRAERQVAKPEAIKEGESKTKTDVKKEKEAAVLTTDQKLDITKQKVKDFAKKYNIISSDPNVKKMGLDGEKVIDEAFEIIKAGAKTAKEIKVAIEKAIDHVKSSDWYKALTSEQQKEVAEGIMESSSAIAKAALKPKDFSVKENAPERTVEALNERVQNSFEENQHLGDIQAYEAALKEAKSDPLYDHVYNEAAFEKAMWEKFFGKRRFTERYEAQYDNPNLTKNAKYYSKISLVETLDQAQKQVKEMGIDNAIATIVDKNAPIAYHSRIAIGEVAIDAIEKQITEAKAKGETPTDLYVKQAQIVEAVSEIGTQLAQGLNAFKLWQKLSPEAQAIRFEKNHEKVREGGGTRAKKKGERMARRAKKINEEAAVESLSSPEVQKIINEAPNKAAVRSSKAYGDSNKIVSRSRYEEAKKKLGGKLFSSPFQPEVLEIATFHTEALIRQGAYKFQDFAEAMVGEFGKKVKPYLKEIYDRSKTDMLGKGFREKDFLSEKDVNEFIESDAIKGIGKQKPDLRELVKSNFVDHALTKEQFIDKVLSSTGLDKAQATKLVELLSEKFESAVKDKKAKMLDSMLSKKERKRIVKEEWEKIVEYSNLGGFDNQKLADMIADKIGIPKLTEAQMAKHKELAKKISSEKSSFKKYEAIEELLKYEANIEGLNYGELATSVWYARILSGYKTHLLNLGANSVNTFFRVLLAMRNPTDLPYMLKGAVEGAQRGVYEAYSTLKTGYSPIKGKLEIPDQFENLMRSDSWLKNIAFLRYVGRTLKAADVLSYTINKEMRAYQLAKRDAVNQGFDKISKETFKVVSEKLFNTKERLEEARSQAKSEGFSGVEYKRRVWEIMEESRDATRLEDAKNFAARATWNYDPEGTLGVLNSAVNSAINAISYKGIAPLRFFVPFTRVIANVANDYVEYFPPYGILRAAKGGIGLKAFEKAEGLAGVLAADKYRKYTSEERWDALTKAAIGTTAMILAYLASEPDENGESAIQITANGTGNWAKNPQLMEEGWHPYSIKIGDKWISYINTPLAIALTPIGVLRDKAKYQDIPLDDENLLNEVGALTWASMRYFNDMTFLRSMNEFTTAVGSQDPNATLNFFDKQLPKIAKGFVISNLYTQLMQDYEKASGMTSKENKGWKAVFLRNIPIARNSLNDKVNIIGEPVFDDTDRFFSYVEKDEFFGYIIDNNAYIPKFNKKADSNWILDGEIERMMTDDEEFEFNKVSGQEIKRRVLDLKNGVGDDYESWTDKEGEQITDPSKDDVQDKVSKIVRDVRKKTKQELFQPAE